ncbi:MAG: hypothetical protein N3D12_03445 [Candidatus Methanomethyliaceae archaeon]|nr:hypothetical protein [Candidatus Methanomethyliaceae archaeon]
MDLLFLGEYAILILFDWLRGISSWGLPGYGLPGTPWTNTFLLIYVMEWLCWFVIPVVTMLWWRSWAKKHPELVQEL